MVFFQYFAELLKFACNYAGIIFSAAAEMCIRDRSMDTRPALLTRSGSKLSLAEMFRRPALAERP